MFSNSYVALMVNSQTPAWAIIRCALTASSQRTNANHSTVQLCDFHGTPGAQNDRIGAAVAPQSC